MKIKKGDSIIILAGKDKGKKGRVEKVFLAESKVLVPGLNMYKRHMKKKDEKSNAGIVDFARPMLASKVSLVCPSCSKPTRVGYRIVKGEKERMCKKCEQKI